MFKIKICKWPEGTEPAIEDDPCECMCEGNSDYCGTHNQKIRKQNAPKKEKKFYSIPRVSSKPKKGGFKVKKITYLCSDGTRVTQDQIDARRSEAYKKAYPVQSATCHGCWSRKAQGSAHVIAQARCKAIGKTELIWNPLNFFPGCLHCNSAIENPKGQNWKRLLNIQPLLEFIKIHDSELYQKFMNNLPNQDREPTI